MPYLKLPRPNHKFRIVAVFTLTILFCSAAYQRPGSAAPQPGIMNWEVDPRLEREGVVSTMLLDDGSALRGTVKYDTEASKYTITTAHGVFSFSPEAVLGILGEKQTDRVSELRQCLGNLRVISEAVRRYAEKFGREGIRRMREWQKNSLYLLLLQVEHEFERTPKCPYKWGVYSVTDVVDAEVTCSRHGKEYEVLTNIRRILSEMDDEIPLAPIDPDAEEDPFKWKLPGADSKKKVR